MNQIDMATAVEPFAGDEIGAARNLLQNRRGIGGCPETRNALAQNTTNTAGNKISFVPDQ